MKLHIILPIVAVLLMIIAAIIVLAATNSAYHNLVTGGAELYANCRWRGA